jgi:hypothetical protein
MKWERIVEIMEKYELGFFKQPISEGFQLFFNFVPQNPPVLI